MFVSVLLQHCPRPRNAADRSYLPHSDRSVHILTAVPVGLHSDSRSRWTFSLHGHHVTKRQPDVRTHYVAIHGASSVPAEPLHSAVSPTQNSRIHDLSGRAVGRNVFFWLCAVALRQNGLSGHHLVTTAAAVSRTFCWLLVSFRLPRPACCLSAVVCG